LKVAEHAPLTEELTHHASITYLYITFKLKFSCAFLLEKQAFLCVCIQASLSMFVCVTDNMEVFLTLAERQFIVKYELDGLRAQRDLRIPGLPDSCTLLNRDNICE